jgi:hypothetical protein
MLPQQMVRGENVVDGSCLAQSILKPNLMLPQQMAGIESAALLFSTYTTMI